MNYNNVINWFFLPFLIVVLMLRTYGAKASHMWWRSTNTNGAKG